MPYERTGYAPWSLTREAGVQSATVDGTLQIPQYGQPIIDIGFVDEKGNWQGRKSSDRDFIGITRAEGIANGGEVLAPDTSNFPSLDMTGFTDLFLAIKPSVGGNYAMTAVMGPDTQPFANLSPVAAARTLRGADALDGSVENVLLDSAEDCQTDLWNIIIIKERLAEQRNMQFKIVNNSGSAYNIEIAFMRLV